MSLGNCFLHTFPPSSLLRCKWLPITSFLCVYNQIKTGWRGLSQQLLMSAVWIMWSQPQDPGSSHPEADVMSVRWITPKRLYSSLPAIEEPDNDLTRCKRLVCSCLKFFEMTSTISFTQRALLNKKDDSGPTP